MRFSEERQTVADARQIRLLCPHCYGAVYVTFEFPFTGVRRQRAISAAVEEHRRLCTGAPAEAERVYRIDYPRQ